MNLRLVGRKESGESTSWAAVSQKLRVLDIVRRDRWFGGILKVATVAAASSSCSFVSYKFLLSSGVVLVQGG